MRLLISNHESDAVIDFLQKCSQELLESTIDETTTEPSSKCSEPDTRTKSPEPDNLESFKDLICFNDHLYHKQGITLNNTLRIPDSQTNLNPLSPISTHSECDTGYESASSPALSLDDGEFQLLELNDIDMQWDETLKELFPDIA